MHQIHTSLVWIDRDPGDFHFNLSRPSFVSILQHIVNIIMD